jgi:uncharacterized membrane protein
MMLSETAVGWLLLAAALVTFAVGIGIRVLVGRHRQAATVQRAIRGFRGTAFARVLFGPIANDALDDGELDAMILMPALIIACGLCLVSVFLLGYDILT